MNRWITALALTALAISPACKCGERATESPARYVAKSAEMIVEIPDVGALAKERDHLIDLLKGIATDQQITQAQAQLARLLGFDPTTKEGLEAAGLPASGAAAIELSDLGRNVLWIVPVGNAEKLKATIDQLTKARTKIDETKEEKLPEGSMTIHSTAWGNDKFPAAAYVIAKGFVFVGLGRKGPDLVKAALARTKEDCMLSNEEYAGLDKDIGNKAMVRAIAPAAATMADQLSRAVQDAGAPSAFVKSLKSVGWATHLESRAISVEGRFRFDQTGQEQVKKVLSVPGKTPAGVLEAQHEGAALVAMIAGDVQAFLTFAAPPGSPEAADIDSAFAEVKEKTGVDVREKVLPNLSGHAAISFGFGDTAALQADLQAILADPTKVLWTLMAFGAKSEADAKTLATFADNEAFMKERNLTRGSRKVGEQEVTLIQTVEPGASDPKPTLLMESFVDDGAWIMSNSTVETERLIQDKATSPSDPLNGKGGFFADLRLVPISKAARSLDITKLIGGGAEAIMIRGMVEKALQILERLDHLELRIEPEAQGALARLKLVFAAPAK